MHIREESMGDQIKTLDGGVVSLGEASFNHPVGEGKIIGAFETDRYSNGDTIKFDPDTLNEYNDWMASIAEELEDITGVTAIPEDNGILVELIKKDVETIKSFIEDKDAEILEETKTYDGFDAVMITNTEKVCSWE